MEKDVFESIINCAKKVKGKTLVFPEGDDFRVVGAVKKLIDETNSHVVVLGDEKRLKELYDSHKNIVIVDPKIDTLQKNEYAKKFYELRKHKGLTEKQAFDIISQVNYFACMMLYSGDADGVVSGVVSKSADVMRPAFQIIKQKPKTPFATSCFIMEVPSQKRLDIGQNGLMIFADCAVCQYPDAVGLAHIARLGAKFAKNICGMTPRVAMLSYLSHGESLTDENVAKVKNAVAELRSTDPRLIVDGELQLDAAIDPEIAKRKAPNSKLKGRANVLVFPDINAGNIGYKLVQRFAGVRAVGPIIMGLNKPVNDLSRGANMEEVYLTALITILQSAAN